MLTRRRWLWVVAGAIWLAPAGLAAGQSVLYVDARSSTPATDPLVGSSWDKAYRSLATALAAVNMTPPGAAIEVRIAAGTYRPDESDGPDTGTGDRAATFGLGRGDVAIRGGFRGIDGAGDPNDRDLAQFETVLSGDLDEDDGPDFTNRDDNAYHVLATYDPDVATAVALDGITIQSGNATDEMGFAGGRGGGLRSYGTAVELKNVRIESCEAREGGGIWWDSFKLDGAMLTMTGCVVAGNRAVETGGGGLYLWGDAAITNCIFDGNAAATSGGGIAIVEGRSVLVGLIIRYNSAGTIGGGIFDYGQFTTILGCVLQGNHAGADGGGLWTTAGGIELLESVLEGNSAHAGGGVAVVQVDSFHQALIANCRVFGNTAVEGGGIALSARRCTVVNTVINGNIATEDGGGLLSSSCSTSLDVYHNVLSSTIVGNRAMLSGGGIARRFNAPSDDPSDVRLRVVSSIVALNECEGAGNCGELLRVEKCEFPIFPTSYGEASFESSCVSGTVSLAGVLDSDYFGGSQLVDVDPSFEFVPAGDDGAFGTADDSMELSFDSPCLELGDASALAGLPAAVAASDALARARIVGALDIGALERPAANSVGGTRRWRYPVDGTWQDALWWSGGAPDALSTARFDELASPEVTVPFRGDAVSGRLLVAGGDVTLDLRGWRLDLLEEGQPPLVIGDESDSNALLRLVNGEGAAATMVIGRDEGALGSLTLDGSAAFWEIGGEATIGLGGSGELSIVNGAELSSLYGFLGAQQGATGRVVIDGLGSLWRAHFLLAIGRGELTLANGGVLEAGLGGFGGALVDSRGTLSGVGDVRGAVLNFGEISPGVRRDVGEQETADDLGTLSIDGSYLQLGALGGGNDNTGALSLRIGGSPAAPASDMLAVTGVAELAGGLLVRFLDGFEADPGALDGLALLRAPEIEGGFDVALLPALPGGQSFLIVEQTVVDGEDAMVLRVLPLADAIDVGPDETFTTEFTPARAVAGDLDADGDVDIALGIAGPTEGAPDAPGSVIILLNSGIGPDGWSGFTLGAVSQFGVQAPLTGLTLFQANGDGVPDIAVTTLGASGPSSPGAVRVLVNSGDATFTLLPQSTQVGVSPTDLVGADFDGDGRDDLAVTNSQADTVTLLRNLFDGESVLLGQAVSEPVGAEPSGVAVTDADGDGDPDLVVANRGDETILLLLNRQELAPTWGPSQFVGGASAPAGPDPDSVLPGSDDDEKKGEPENLQFLLVVNRAAGAVTVLPSLGNGLFAPGVSLPVGARALSAAAADLDEDGDLDIAVAVEDAAGARSVQLLRNDTPPSGSPLTFAAGGEIPGVTAEPVIVLAEDVDGDGDSDLIAIGEPSSQTQAVGLGEGVVPSIVPLLSFYCPADLDGDRAVSFSDLNVLVGAFNTAQGAVGYDVRADVDRDGDVDFADLNVLLADFNTDCAATRPR